MAYRTPRLWPGLSHAVVLAAIAGLSATPALTQALVGAEDVYPLPLDAVAAHPDLLDGTLSAEGDLKDDEKPKRSFFRFPTALAPWLAFKQQLAEKTGFVIGGSYGVLWQNYSETPLDDRDAVGHKFTFNLSYPLVNKGSPDALWFEMAVEDRQPLFGVPLPPLQAGIAAGSIVPTAATWGDFALGVTQAYLRQSLFNNSFQWSIGKLFAPNYVNAFPFFDDNRQFLSQAFSTSPTIASSLRGFGAVAAWYPTEGGFYVKAGMYTARSDDNGITIDDFLTVPEHFYHVEVGWSGLASVSSGLPLQARGPMDTNNVHVTAWYRDDLKDRITLARTPEAHGVAFNANWMMRDDIMVFLRGGWSENWFVDANLSAGFGWRPREAYNDLFGLGAGWARPSNPFLREQWTFETFYRFQVTENLAITPNIQLVLNPALNTTTDTLWVFGLRTRLTF